MNRIFAIVAGLATVVGLLQQSYAQWDPPADYYSGVNSTGTLLKSQLEAAMSAGHIQGRYGDFRFSAEIHDQDPNLQNNIWLVYDGVSVNSGWDSGATWNREHVWPQSRQPGSASNSSTGNLGDPHALRPSTPSVNSSRSNKPFGLASNSGSFANLGTYWFPGDTCKGDVARSLFYSDTRWSFLGISLVNGVPNGNQMGDLDSLVGWHYQDPPDDFERRRNHAIFSANLNPSYFTNNRNAFVDHPEYVWSIYVDQQNDSMITVADGEAKLDGSSSLLLDFGKVIRGSTTPTSQVVTLDKFGLDGTYYSVEPFVNASSTVVGRHNAFESGTIDFKSFEVSLQYDPNTSDNYVGTVMIDNLDITSDGGTGRGSNDENDFIDMIVKVVESGNGSFDSSNDQDAILVDLGEIEVDQPIPAIEFSIHNLPSGAGSELTAALDFVSLTANPTDTFLTVFGDSFVNLTAGDSVIFSIGGTPEITGKSSTQMEFLLADESIPGSSEQALQMTVTYNVISGVLLGDVDLNGEVNLLDVRPFIDVIDFGVYQAEADVNQDGAVNLLDVGAFIELLANS